MTRPTGWSTRSPRSSRRGSTRRSASRPTIRTATRSPTPTSSGPRARGRILDMALKDIFSFLFQRSAGEERVAQYVIREHDRGRALSEILEDRYVVNRLQSPEQRARLLDRPEIIQAVAVETSTSTRIVITYGSAWKSCGAIVTPRAWRISGSAESPPKT